MRLTPSCATCWCSAIEDGAKDPAVGAILLTANGPRSAPGWT